MDKTHKLYSQLDIHQKESNEKFNFDFMTVKMIEMPSERGTNIWILFQQKDKRLILD